MRGATRGHVRSGGPSRLHCGKLLEAAVGALIEINLSPSMFAFEAVCGVLLPPDDRRFSAGCIGTGARTRTRSSHHVSIGFDSNT